MEQRTTLIIADSQTILREGIASRLRDGCDVEVVAEAEDGYGTIKACRQHQPELLLLDLSITRPSGGDTISKLKKSLPELKIVVMTSEATAETAILALSLGAAGFISKQSKGSVFVNAVNAAKDGHSYLPLDLLEDFVRTRRNIKRTGNAFGLSPRELEILEACIKGYSTKEVAHNLNISVRTVETHRNSIYKKTACRDYGDLACIIGH